MNSARPLPCPLGRHAFQARLAVAALALFAAWPAAFAEGIEPPTKGQTVYVPIYSEIRHGNVTAKGRPEAILLSVLVSIRNTDPKTAIRVVSAPYYNTDGALIRNSVQAPKTIPLFGTLEIFVEMRENAGGSGANYAIKWDAPTPVSPPTIEALHLRFQAGYSLAFISRGRAISEP